MLNVRNNRVTKVHILDAKSTHIKPFLRYMCQKYIYRCPTDRITTWGICAKSTRFLVYTIGIGYSEGSI